MGSSRPEQLAALIDAQPHSPDGYLVLADLLHEIGDVRGELITLQHARLKRAAEAAGVPLAPSVALTQEPPVGREKELLDTEINPELVGGDVSGDWFCGYLWWAEIGGLGRGLGWETGPGRSLKWFLEHPSLRHLQELDLTAGTFGQATDYIIPVLALEPRRSLRKLSLQQLHWDDANDPPRDKLDFSSLWPMVPRLRGLVATAHHITLGAPPDRTLDTLALNGEVRGADVASLIARSTTLRELELNDLIDGEDLWTRLPQLHHLGATQAITIEGEALRDKAVESVLRAASLLQTVPQLTLPFADEEQQAALRAILPLVRFAEPRDEARYDVAETEDSA